MDSIPVKRSVAPEILRRNQVRETTERMQFSLLQNELPDANIKLARQPKCLSKLFTLFPELPTELRLAIWKWMIPRRTLDLECLAYCYGEERRHCPSLRVPEVLHVSKESRAETIKYYSIVLDHEETTQQEFWSCTEYQKRSKSAGCFFFSPVFDTLSIRDSDMGWDYRYIGETKDRREALEKINYFRSIELPIHWRKYGDLDFTPHHLHDFNPLLRSPQLEEIHMGQRWGTEKSPSRHRENNGYKDKLLCWTKDLEKFLIDFVEYFQVGRPPKVIVGKPEYGYSTRISRSVLSGCTNGNSSLLRSKADYLPISNLKSCNLNNI